MLKEFGSELLESGIVRRGVALLSSFMPEKIVSPEQLELNRATADLAYNLGNAAVDLALLGPGDAVTAESNVDGVVSLDITKHVLGSGQGLYTKYFASVRYRQNDTQKEALDFDEIFLSKDEVLLGGHEPILGDGYAFSMTKQDDDSWRVATPDNADVAATRELLDTHKQAAIETMFDLLYEPGTVIPGQASNDQFSLAA